MGAIKEKMGVISRKINRFPFFKIRMASNIGWYHILNGANAYNIDRVSVNAIFSMDSFEFRCLINFFISIITVNIVNIIFC